MRIPCFCKSNFRNHLTKYNVGISDFIGTTDKLYCTQPGRIYISVWRNVVCCPKLSYSLHLRINAISYP
jgi:hypothetical protein